MDGMKFKGTVATFSDYVQYYSGADPETLLTGGSVMEQYF